MYGWHENNNPHLASLQLWNHCWLASCVSVASSLCFSFYNYVARRHVCSFLIVSAVELLCIIMNTLHIWLYMYHIYIYKSIQIIFNARLKFWLVQTWRHVFTTAHAYTISSIWPLANQWCSPSWKSTVSTKWTHHVLQSFGCFLQTKYWYHIPNIYL